MDGNSIMNNIVTGWLPLGIFIAAVIIFFRALGQGGNMKSAVGQFLAIAVFAALLWQIELLVDLGRSIVGIFTG